MKQVVCSLPIRSMTFDGRVAPRPVIAFGQAGRQYVDLAPSRDYYTTVEPSLLTYDLVKGIADDNHLEVVGPDMVGELPVCNFQFTYDYRNPNIPLSELRVHNLRTTADLVAPWGQASWQINTRTNEFQILVDSEGLAA